MNSAPPSAPGPLAGIRVVELAGIGPAPHACTLLADLGASVIRIDRPGGQLLAGGPFDLMTRGRPSVALDLKNPAAISAVLELVASADVLVEGMRPGVAERLGLGPETCSAVNERLVYARMTGWGQSGPLAHSAGHDINYLAISGVLNGLGQDKGKPSFPQNLLGDFGGGSTYLVVGILAALMSAQRSGRGQVVDAAIVDGALHLSTMLWSFLADGSYNERRAENLLDGGMPYYDIYETSDGRSLAIGALEPQFFTEMVTRLGIADRCPDQHDVDRHTEMRQLISEAVRSRSMSEWAKEFDGTDACVTPVLTLREAADHPHIRARGAVTSVDGVPQPAPAPRFDRTPTSLSTVPPAAVGQDTRTALETWGVDPGPLLESGAAWQA